MDFPILAHWQYGLGRSVAFTSDARTMRGGRQGWDRDWAGSEMYSKFWEQVVDWALRPTETGRMVMMTEFRDGKVKVTIDARDESNRPMTDLILDGGITSPSLRADDSRRIQLKFEQKNSGLYEAEFKAKEAGSYFISAQARRMQNGREEKKEDVDSVRSGVTIPYSPEFADLESNTALLERLRDITGGMTIAEDRLATAAQGRGAEAEQARGQLAADVFRPGLPQFKNLQPVWYWLVFYTCVLLFFDIAVRRIAVQPAQAIAAGQRWWERLRGRVAVATETPQFMDRLQSRKAQVSETLDQLRAARRFEGAERIVTAPAGAEQATAVIARPSTLRPPAQQRVGPDKQEEAADYASRLLKAKKRVWQEREEDKE
jgi:hypothetical protein